MRRRVNQICGYPDAKNKNSKIFLPLILQRVTRIQYRESSTIFGTKTQVHPIIEGLFWPLNFNKFIFSSWFLPADLSGEASAKTEVLTKAGYPELSYEQ
jgi:hypothetical protein